MFNLSASSMGFTFINDFFDFIFRAAFDNRRRKIFLSLYNSLGEILEGLNNYFNICNKYTIITDTLVFKLTSQSFLLL